MLYTDIEVEIPAGAWRQKRTDTVTYVYMNPSRSPACPDKYKGRYGFMVGRIKLVDGKEMLTPNNVYYELMGIPLPDSATQKRTGKKTVPESEGFGVIGSLLLSSMGVTACLEKALGRERALKLQACALYLAQGRHDSFAGLEKFTAKNLKNALGSSFKREKALKLFNSVTATECETFYTAWNAKNRKCQPVLSDVAAFAEISRDLTVTDRNPDNDGMPLKNLAVFTCGDNDKPLFMCGYDGTLLDGTIFNDVMSRARACNLDDSGLSVVLDGSGDAYGPADPDLLSLEHLKTLPFLVRAACRGGNDTVSKACLERRGSLKRKISVPVGDFSLGGVEGKLYLCRERTKSEIMAGLKHLQKLKRAELESLPGIPAGVTDFDRWAKSYSPYFKVSKDSGAKGFKFEEDKDGLAALADLQCIAALFTGDAETSAKELLERFQQKKERGTYFEQIKECICDRDETDEFTSGGHGKLLTLFVSYVVWQTMRHRMEYRLSEYKIPFQDALEILRGIKLSEQANGTWWCPDGITREQWDFVSPLKLRGIEKGNRPDYRRFAALRAKQRSK